MKYTIVCLSILLSTFSGIAQKKGEKDAPKQSSLSGMSFRSIGPALVSGRVIDLAVNSNNHDEFFVAAASGGVWKTENHGNTFTPVFDGQGSYSIGCVSYDPNNEHTIWVGTGENNNQRSVAYGDGVYKSLNDGKTWKNMGLKTSEHIAKVIVKPGNSNTIYVAAYGPLWSEGGERGIYQSNDGGETWDRILHVSENTGSVPSRKPGDHIVLKSHFTDDMVLVRPQSIPVRVAKYNVALQERNLWAVRAQHEILSNMILFTCKVCCEEFPTFHPAFDPRPLEMASGSEKTMAAMAIRLALLSVSSLPTSDIMILDEPGTALDEEHLQSFTELLDMVKGYFKTVLLISHLDSLKDVVDMTIDISKVDGCAFVNQ